MIRDTRIYPTRYPLFDIFLNIWKFHIATVLYSPSSMSASYEYIRIELAWNQKVFYHFRLWDTTIRIEDRLGKLINDNEYSGSWSIERLEEIRRIADLRIIELKQKEKKS